MISLLCPSRTRHKLLYDNLTTTLFNATSDIEVLVGIDKDDPGREFYDVLDDFGSAVKVVKFDPVGYHQLHVYYNELARKAKGDWLMLFNDDGVIVSEHWDKLFQEFDPDEPLVLNFWHEIDNLFPAISRKLYDIIGHFSLQTHADSWVQQIGERAGIQRYVPGMKIIHNKPTDETGQASTHAAMSHTGAEFSSPRFQDLINQDVAKVKDWLEKNGKR